MADMATQMRVEAKLQQHVFGLLGLQSRRRASSCNGLQITGSFLFVIIVFCPLSHTLQGRANSNDSESLSIGIVLGTPF